MTEETTTIKNDSKIKNPLGRTSLFLAAGRAIESEKPENERLFYDPFAKYFAGEEGVEWLNKMGQAASDSNDENSNANVNKDGFVKYIAFRTQFIDQEIEKCVKNNNPKQMVIFGVGCDTRCYRLPFLPKDMSCFEIDFKDIIKYRQMILYGKCQDLLNQNICPVRTIVSVGCNVNDFEKWKNLLFQNGFKTNNQTIWIMEGAFFWVCVRVLWLFCLP